MVRLLLKKYCPHGIARVSGLKTLFKFHDVNFDKLAKSPRFRHAPAFAGAGSAKAGIQNYLKKLDSRLAGMTSKDVSRLITRLSILVHKTFFDQRAIS
jgi:hypothetical protein